MPKQPRNQVDISIPNDHLAPHLPRLLAWAARLGIATKGRSDGQWLADLVYKRLKLGERRKRGETRQNADQLSERGKKAVKARWAKRKAKE